MKDIPAFPSKQKALMIKSEHIDIASEYEIEHNGMTLRDYFAAQALTGAQIWDAVLNGKNAQLAQGGAEKLSDIAYAVANAMMESRNATQ